MVILLHHDRFTCFKLKDLSSKWIKALSSNAIASVRFNLWSWENVDYSNSFNQAILEIEKVFNRLRVLSFVNSDSKGRVYEFKHSKCSKFTNVIVYLLIPEKRF